MLSRLSNSAPQRPRYKRTWQSPRFALSCFSCPPRSYCGVESQRKSNSPKRSSFAPYSSDRLCGIQYGSHRYWVSDPNERCVNFLGVLLSEKDPRFSQSSSPIPTSRASVQRTRCFDLLVPWIKYDSTLVTKYDSPCGNSSRVECCLAKAKAEGSNPFFRWYRTKSPKAST